MDSEPPHRDVDPAPAGPGTAVNPALLAALGAATGFGVATLLQGLGARHSEGGLRAFLNPLVMGGLALDGASSLLSLVAQAHLPLFVVQTIIASSVVVVVLGAPVVLRARRRPLDVAAALLTVVCLGVLAAASGPESPIHSSHLLPGLSVGVGALVLATVAFYRRGPAWLMGTCSALGYAASAIGVRTARITGPLISVILQPAALVVVVAVSVGILAYMRALESGPVGMVAATGSVIEVVVPGVVGILAFGDHTRPGWAPAAAIACAVALAACVVLAFSPAAVSEESARVDSEPTTPNRSS